MAINKKQKAEELKKKALDTFDAELCEIVDKMPMKAIEGIAGCQHPMKVLEAEARKILNAEKAREGHEKATGEPLPSETANSTPRKRKPKEGVPVALEDGTELFLTTKQNEFLNNLSRVNGWDKTGTAGEYSVNEYAQELSGLMQPTSVGAILTTLREKGLLTTEKKRDGALKVCMFKLTDKGAYVYNALTSSAK